MNGQDKILDDVSKDFFKPIRTEIDELLTKKTSSNKTSTTPQTPKEEKKTDVPNKVHISQPQELEPEEKPSSKFTLVLVALLIAVVAFLSRSYFLG